MLARAVSQKLGSECYELPKTAGPFAPVGMTEVIAAGCSPSKAADKSVRPTRSILWHFRIYAVGPGQDPAGQVVNFLESGLAEEVHRFGAAHAGAAMGHDLLAGVQFVHPFGQVAERNQMSADVADLIFVRLAHIEDE